MFIKANTLDDILHNIYTKLLKVDGFVKTSRGRTKEISGVLIELTNPRARLSSTEQRGKAFSCLGEFLWYLSKSNKLNFISYYLREYGQNSDDGKTIYGAYGPRLFNKNGINQVENVIEILKKKPTSRQVVIQLFDAIDITKKRNDIPCTCTLQFLIRNNALHMFTNMRSNDAVLGLPHDIFSFSMLQEMIATKLKVKVGIYKHSVGSLHLYEKNIDSAKQYLKEGYQSTKIIMPSMPIGDPWLSSDILLKAEKRIRNHHKVDASKLGLPNYWADLVRLLQVYRFSKPQNYKKIISIRNEMSSNFYYQFIDKYLPKD